jgi:hypothetical protein
MKNKLEAQEIQKLKLMVDHDKDLASNEKEFERHEHHECLSIYRFLKSVLQSILNFN